MVARAEAHLDAGRPLDALHFVDMVLAEQPSDMGALQVKLGALEQLLDASGRENFSEVRWLEAAESADKDGIKPVRGALPFVTALPADRWAVVTSAPRRIAGERLSHAGQRIHHQQILLARIGLGRGHERLQADFGHDQRFDGS